MHNIIALLFVAFFVFCLWGSFIGDPFGWKEKSKNEKLEVACLNGSNFWVDNECRKQY